MAHSVLLRSGLRVKPLFSAEDSTALRLDETDFLRTFVMRHLNGLVFLQDTHMRYPTQVFPHAANHTPTPFFPQSRAQACRCKVRMSGLRKVGMSAFMGG